MIQIASHDILAAFAGAGAAAPAVSPWAVAVALAPIAGVLLAASVTLFLVLRRRASKARTGRTGTDIALTTLAVVLSPVWLAMVTGVLWLLWRTFLAIAPVFGDTVDDPMAVRWTAFALIGLVTALGALVSAPLALIRVQTTERQTRTAEQGHMTDRIAKAVEQLGAEKTVKDGVQDGIPLERSVPNIEVRIGAILSLERIAQDSTTYDKGRDHVRVMEILCAYIRENAPAENEADPARSAKDHDFEEWEPLPDDADDAAREARPAAREERFGDVILGYGGKVREWAAALPEPREDIQLALRIIGRRNAQQRRVEARWGPDAAEDAEWPFDRPCPRLPDPPKDERHPDGAVYAFKRKLEDWKEPLEKYNAYRLDLRGTNLQGADLSGLVLSGTDFREARMEGSDLREARMEGANLFRARMDGANLRKARMERADLFAARMEGAVLLEARMEGALLRWARMEGADLRGARMEGADLSEARMDANTSFTRAVLRGAAVRNVTLPPDLLSPDQIATMFGDGSVILSDDLRPHRPHHWPEAKLRWSDFHDEWRRWQREGDACGPPERQAPLT